MKLIVTGLLSPSATSCTPQATAHETEKETHTNHTQPVTSAGVVGVLATVYLDVPLIVGKGWVHAQGSVVVPMLCKVGAVISPNSQLEPVQKLV